MRPPGALISARGAAEPPPRGWGAPAEPLPPTPPAEPPHPPAPATPPPRGAVGGADPSHDGVGVGTGGTRQRRLAGAARREQAARTGQGPLAAALAPRAGHRAPHADQPLARPGRLDGRQRGPGRRRHPVLAAPAPRCPPAWSDPRCEHRPPEEPLRVYIGGDSIIRDAGDAFLNIASDSPLFETTLHYENATGLTRPDFYDWPAAFRQDMEAHRPEVAFVLFGGNDSQGIVGPNGEAVRGPGRPEVAGGVRAPGRGSDGHPPGGRPDRVLDRPATDA